MTPLEVRARIEALLLSSAATDPSAPTGKVALALLSRMPRPLCGTPSCAALGGRLSRKTGKCGRCGATKVVDRYTRANGTHFDRDRDHEHDRPLPQTIQLGTAAVTEQSFQVKKLPTRHCNAVLSAKQKKTTP